MQVSRLTSFQQYFSWEKEETTHRSLDNDEKAFRIPQFESRIKNKRFINFASSYCFSVGKPFCVRYNSVFQSYNLHG